MLGPRASTREAHHHAAIPSGTAWSWRIGPISFGYKFQSSFADSERQASCVRSAGESRPRSTTASATNRRASMGRWDSKRTWKGCPTAWSSSELCDHAASVFGRRSSEEHSKGPYGFEAPVSCSATCLRAGEPSRASSGSSAPGFRQSCPKQARLQHLDRAGGRGRKLATNQRGQECHAWKPSR